MCRASVQTEIDELTTGVGGTATVASAADTHEVSKFIRSTSVAPPPATKHYKWKSTPESVDMKVFDAPASANE